MLNVVDVFSARVPRYTSYPTAPHFHAGIDEPTYRRWLGELTSEGSLSLYVHVPFCDTLCWFCGCHTTVVNHYSPISAYLELLRTEIDLVADIVGRDFPVSHIHWGGGSPTILRPDDILGLSDSIRANFAVAGDAEFAIEIDPRGFGGDIAKALAAAGVNRASVGVQDCDPLVQSAINRVQPMAETARTVETLRNVGINKLNVDLIYGLPHQTVGGIRKTIDAAVTLAPDRVAVFGYAHVPHFKKHQTLIPESALPGLKERFDQAEAAHARLCEFGFVPVGLDHFAKPSDSMAIAQRAGRLARNFQGYTTDNASVLIGLGASSIGSLPNGYVQNISDVPGYRAAIREGHLPVSRGVALSWEDRARRAVIEQLMCNLSVDLGEVAAAHGFSDELFADSVRKLAALEREGVVSIEGDRISVAEKWRAATRLVCAAFDSYLSNETARHALAV